MSIVCKSIVHEFLLLPEIFASAYICKGILVIYRIIFNIIHSHVLWIPSG